MSYFQQGCLEFTVRRCNWGWTLDRRPSRNPCQRWTLSSISGKASNNFEHKYHDNTKPELDKMFCLWCINFFLNRVVLFTTFLIKMFNFKLIFVWVMDYQEKVNRQYLLLKSSIQSSHFFLKKTNSFFFFFSIHTWLQ